MPNLERTYIPGESGGSSAVVISTKNSTSTPLGANGTFTGEAELSTTNSVAVVVSASHDGIYNIQVSADQVSWSTIGSYNYRADGVNRPHIFITFRRYVRVVFINTSGQAQDSLKILTYFGDNFGLLNVPSNGIVSQDADTVLTLALTEEVAHARGQIDGVYLVNKFGENLTIDTGTVPEDVWDNGGIYTGFPITAVERVALISTSNQDTPAGTGISKMVVEGLDADYGLQSEEVTMSGTVAALTTETYRRVFRVYASANGSGATGLASNAGVITVRHETTTTNVFSVIQVGVGQSRTATYTVPLGYTAFMRSWGAALRDNNANNAKFVFWTRVVGGPVRLQRSFNASNTAESNRTVYGGVVFQELTDIALRVTSVLSNGADVDAHFEMIVSRNEVGTAVSGTRD